MNRYQFSSESPSFIEDITKTFWSLFFPDTVYFKRIHHITCVWNPRPTSSEAALSILAATMKY